MDLFEAIDVRARAAHNNMTSAMNNAHTYEQTWADYFFISRFTTQAQQRKQKRFLDKSNARFVCTDSKSL